MFTSDLSVPEFSLTQQIGLRPIAQVMGSSVYQVGYQGTDWWSQVGIGGAFAIELDVLAKAWNEARGLALERIAQEAARAGASAVVGLELRSDLHDWSTTTGSATVEQMATGTAVGGRAAPKPRGHAKPHAFDKAGAKYGQASIALSDLPLAEHLLLAQSGVGILGVVAWTSVHFVSWSGANPLLERVLSAAPGQNYEQPDLTECFYTAREQVMGELNEQAEALNATGVLGVRLDHKVTPHTIGSGSRERPGMLVTVSALGTAVAEGARVPLDPPQPTVDLTY